jgi:hypothetical protein
MRPRLSLLLLATGVLFVGACQPATATRPTGNQPVPTVTAAPATPAEEATPSLAVVQHLNAGASPSAAATASPDPAGTTGTGGTNPGGNGATCGGDYYVNSAGACVHRPVAANTVPAGATAECKDGTYSFSQHRSGTCSGHGGVKRWL